jgi:hypothetical protein
MAKPKKYPPGTLVRVYEGGELIYRHRAGEYGVAIRVDVAPRGIRLDKKKKSGIKYDGDVTGQVPDFS